MNKRGKIPSLICGVAGKPRIVVAKGVRHCKRCKTKLGAATKCVEIPIPGSMGRKTYCCDCFLDMITKSHEDLNLFEQQIKMQLQ
jgi:hypothetical protein